MPALSEILRKEIGEILRIAPDKLDPDRSVYDMGMDSMMGVELVAALEARIGVSLPLMALSEGPTITRLAQRIGQQLRPQAGGSGAVAPPPSLSQQVHRIADQHGSELGAQAVQELSESFAAGDRGVMPLTRSGPP